MNTALVIGISGGFGASVAEALAARGWAIRALMRDPARLPASLSAVDVRVGDAMDPAAVRRAAEGVDVLVYAANPPRYDWQDKALPMLEATAQAVESLGLTVLFPGNVYVLDPAQGPDHDEQAPLRPCTGKGETRLAMERRLQQASERGARVIVLRMGDYIGAHAPSAWLGVLLKKTRHGYTLSAPGPRDLLHTWAYLPDAACTAVALLERRDELPAWSLFHYRGYRLSIDDIAAALRRVSGRPVRVRPFPWWVLRLLAPFSVLFRGLLEMRYLWQHPLNLDDGRLRQLLGSTLVTTPFDQALIDSGLVSERPATVAVRHPGRVS